LASKRKDDVFLAITATLSALSTCDRKPVGALIVIDGRCVSWGYNGAPPGLPHCDENIHGWQEAMKHGWAMTSQEMVTSFGCRNATHAEANALAFAARHGIPTDGGTLYVTVSPCDVCARLLIAAGIVRVVYAEQYRDTTGLELLRKAGVTVG